MIAAATDLEEVFLNPGDFCFGGPRTRISTLLGSCVSITLWHPRRHIGGMCHYMLTERHRPSNAPLDGRFGEEAFAMFLRAIRDAGTTAGEYEAKLFGGGNMFSGRLSTVMDIGRRNVELGRRLLTRHHIPLVAEHVGGSGRRKLHFHVSNGNVWVAFVGGSDALFRSPHG
ncbi:MAG: chemotaxis protein CheD [Dechloromonas sp.]|nr:chemotaxis protein CheD [Dechloromonas sp.]